MTDFEIPGTLTRALSEHHCIPFVGTGISIPAGFPSWKQFLSGLIDMLKIEQLNWHLALGHQLKGNYLQAIQEARQELGLNRYRRFVEDKLAPQPSAALLEGQQLIWALEPPLVMTSNIDTCLETAVTPHAKTLLPTPAGLAYWAERREGEKLLLKLHGTIENPETWCLASDDYERLYREKAYQIAYQSILFQHSILFIGFSLSDPYVLEQFRYAAAIFEGHTRPHFALVASPQGSESPEREEELWKEYNIQTIRYGDHAELPLLLQSLRSRVRGLRTAVPDPEAPGLRPAATVPPDLQHLAIGETIVLTCRVARSRLMGWRNEEVLWQPTPEFFTPQPNSLLERLESDMVRNFREKGHRDSPKYRLLAFRQTGGNLNCSLALTTWALIHGTQSRLGEDSQVADEFWHSVRELTSLQDAVQFPHHIGNHGLVITSDNKVLLNRRTNVDNQIGRISASFEEQANAPHVNSAYENPRRKSNGDKSVFHALQRGAKEELDLDLDESRTFILALAVEASSIAANFLAITWVDATANEAYARWNSAEHRAENLMVPPHLLPSWGIGSLQQLMATDEIELGEHDGVSYSGKWHASSKARLALGLLFDVGQEVGDGLRELGLMPSAFGGRY